MTGTEALDGAGGVLAALRGAVSVSAFAYSVSIEALSLHSYKVPALTPLGLFCVLCDHVGSLCAPLPSTVQGHAFEGGGGG